MLESLREDLRFLHRLRCPGREPTPWSMVRLALGSRGLLLLGGHRVVQAMLRAGDARAAQPLRRRAIRNTATLLDNVVHLLTMSEIRPGSELAPGVYLSDRGNVILGARTVGRGTIIHHRVTVGWSLKAAGAPVVGERVWIGPDTVIAGDIRIGDGSTILPGTVLTRSIPPNTLVEGNPARVVRRHFDNSELRRTLATDVAVP